MMISSGYTFVAEARSLDSPIVGNKWKMRLIGSMEKLPTPRTRQGNTEPVVQSSFSTKEIRDYYMPQDNCVMLRCVQYTSIGHDVISVIFLFIGNSQ